MVWFGKHLVAYVTYVPAALAGLLIPYALAFGNEPALQSAARAPARNSYLLSQPDKGHSGGLQNGGPQDGALQNGSANDRAPAALLRGFMFAQLQRQRLPDALLGDHSVLAQTQLNAQTR